MSLAPLTAALGIAAPPITPRESAQTMTGAANMLPRPGSRRSFLFSTIPSVATDPLREQIFALRYQVYCLECQFLPADNYADGLESDEYDDHSAHFTAHALDHELAGSVRLVRPPSEFGFPFEAHCSTKVPASALPPKEECGEVSRLVVGQRWRRRSGDTLAGVPKEFFVQTTPPLTGRGYDPERRSNSPEILLGLYREMYRYSKSVGVRYWYAAMEASLARALGRLDFVFYPIGPQTDYYGPVTPYLADLRELEERLAVRNPPMLEWFNSED